MSIDRTLTEYKSPPTMARNPEAEQWLDNALQSQPLHFKKHSEVDLDPNSPINLSRFGFRNPNDIKIFLLSPAGDTVKGELSAQIALDEAIEEQQKFEQREHAGFIHRLKAYLLLWLIEKKGHAAEQLRELIEEQNNKAINQSKLAAQTSAPTTSRAAPKSQGLQQTLNDYNSAIKEHETQYKRVSEEESSLTESFEKLHRQKVALENKHAVYMEKLDKFDAELEQHEQLNVDELDAKIQAIETEIHAQSEKIMDLLASDTPGSEEEARKLLDQQNALNLELASLKDLHAQQNEKKVFYDADGDTTPSAKNAAFVVNSNQKIIKKDGTYYLLNQTENFDDLSPEQRQKAKADFQKAEPELMSVKKAVVHTLKMEKEFHNLDKKIDEVSQKTEEKRSEKMNLENKIMLLQSVRASIMQNPELNQENTPKPTPTMSGKAPSMSVSPPQSVIKFSVKLIPFLNMPGLSSKRLFDEVDQDVNTNKKDKSEIKDYFTKLLKQLGLGKIPSLAPLPQTTMQSLLQHMARFGADPTKPGVTPIKSPLDLQNDVKMSPPQESLHPTLSAKTQILRTQKIEEPAPKPESKPFNPTPSPFKTGY